MNFVSQVEEHLRDLGSQTRHNIQNRHSSSSGSLGGYLAILKEASERGLLTLRSLQSSYVAQIRKSSQNGFDSKIEQQPTTQLFENEDLLRPFLLACNYAEAPANLIQISLSAIQLLLGAHAVVPGDVVQIVRILSIQASNTHINEGICLKMLQLCSVAVNYSVQGNIVSNPESMSACNSDSISNESTSYILDEELLIQAFLLCLKMAQNCSSKLSKSSSSVVSNMGSSMWSAASSTISSSSNRSNNASNIGFQNSATSIKTIRKASNATLRQLVFILFNSISSTLDLLPNELKERNEYQGKAFPEHIVSQATTGSKVFADLCILAEIKCDASASSITSNRGALQQVLYQNANLHPPPRSMCFELVDGILAQNKNLFSSNLTFAGILKLQICPLVTTSLLSQYSSLKPSDSGENSIPLTQHDPDSSSNSDRSQSNTLKKTTVEDFLLLIRTIHVAKTIIRTYSAVAEFECYILLHSLLRFLTTISETYQKLPSVEDTYVYKSALNESLPKTDQKLYKLPSILLWPAALTIEVLHSILSDSALLSHINVSFDNDRPLATAIASIAEVLRDFLVVSTSNRYAILEFVSFAEQFSSSMEYSPRFFIDAKEFTKSYDEWDVEVRKPNQAGHSFEGNSVYSPNGSADVSALVTIPSCGEVDVVFASFQCILSLLYSLDEMSLAIFSDSESFQMNLMIDCVASSALSALRHIFNRFHNAYPIITPSVNALIAFSNAILSFNDTEYRYALFALICNAADLSDEGIREDRLLSDYSVELVSALFQIIQNNFDKLTVDDWRYIFEVVTKLAFFMISSPKLSEIGNNTANSLSNSLSRIPVFSSAFSSEALVSVLKAVIEVSISQSKDCELNREKAGYSFENESGEQNNKKGSMNRIGNRLLGLAGRAMHGFSGSANPDSSSLQMHHSKRYGDDLYLETLNILEQTTPSSEKPLMDKSLFTLCLVTGICLANFQRSILFWDIVTKYIYDIGESISSNSVKHFCIRALSSLIISNVSDTHGNQLNVVKARTAPSNSKEKSFFEVDIYSMDEGETTDVGLSQTQVFSPLCEILSKTDHPAFAEMGISLFQSILENTGHKLDGEVWYIILKAISSLSGNHFSSRNSIAWENCCSKAFDCLQLIVKDFIDKLPSTEEARMILLDCCTSFCHSQLDVNASFTATGLLWTLADQDSSPKSIQYVVSKLLELALDRRSEVRNVSVNTLVSLVVGLGNEFTAQQWQHLCYNLLQTMKSNVKEIKGIENSNKNNIHKGNAIQKHQECPMFIHFLRNSKEKHWETTLVLLLQGLERILRQYFDNLLSLSNELHAFDRLSTCTENFSEFWLLNVWENIVNVAFESSVGGEATLAVIDLLVLCTQVTSQAGIREVTDHVRVGTNMQVVDGALRSVREANARESLTHACSSPRLGDLRQSLFLFAFRKLVDIVEAIQSHAKTSDEEDHTKDLFGILFVNEDSIIQYCARLSNGMLGIYQCCRRNELKPSQNLPKNMRNIEDQFLNILKVILKVALIQPPSNFLNQGQRNALELLGIMAKNSSYEALRTLTRFSKEALIGNMPLYNDNVSAFVRSIIAKEAEKELERLFLNREMSSDVVIQSLQIVINEELLPSLDMKEGKAQKISPKVTTMIIGGLNSMSSFEEAGGIIDKDGVWDSVVKIGPHIFCSGFKEANAHKIMTLLPYLVNNTPNQWQENVANLISRSMGRYTEFFYSDNLIDDGEVINLKELGKVTGALFSVLIRMSPLDDEVFRFSRFCLTHVPLLNSAIQGEELGTLMATLVCDEIAKHISATAPIVMDLFPIFSDLIIMSDEDKSLRCAAAQVFKAFDFRKEYETQKNRADAAEAKASDAKRHILELQADVGDLIERLNKLQEEVLALGGASPSCY